MTQDKRYSICSIHHPEHMSEDCPMCKAKIIPITQDKRREAIATKVAEIRQHAQYCSEDCCDGQIADYFLARESELVERVRKVFKYIPHGDSDLERYANFRHELWTILDEIKNG